ncbi:MAG: hypothetical protein ACOCWR_00675 [Oceanidesulfovibrio sp.]
MRRILENWAAAAGLAEEGSRDGALEILRELERLEQSPKAKIIVVADDDALTTDHVTYLAGLAQRLGCEILYLSSNRRFKADHELPERIEALRSRLSRGIRLVYIPASGCLERMLHTAQTRVHRIQFAVLVGQTNKRLQKHLNVPLFSVEA